MKNKKITCIGLAKETESPENPGGLEKRVAMIPSDIKILVDSGCKVYVEHGAGEGIGFSDDEYEKAGATMEDGDAIYKGKEMLIKFKGPSLEKTSKMDPGTILFCMAHFRSFPERARLMEECKLNVLAMEFIVESPKHIPDDIVLSKRFVAASLEWQKIDFKDLNICFLGYDKTMIGGIRRAGNRDPNSQTIYQLDATKEELSHFGESSLYFYDSRFFKNTELLKKLESLSCQLFDLNEFERKQGALAISEYRRSHKAFEFGGRRIQCLHETGMAGARYGFKLSDKKWPRVTILGYGNVGMGAIRESYDQGVRAINILGQTHTTPERIAAYLENSDLIINGAEQPPELRGVNYLVKSEYIGKQIKAGSVVIDLVGGSATNRSPVEDIVECSYLTDPHFVREGVTFSALWGWPMMGMMKESAITYSGQILEVLTQKEKVLNGLDQLTPGVKPALVCGPF